MALVSAICCCNSLRVAPAAAQGLNVSSSLHVKSSSRNRCTLNVVAFGLRSSNSIAEYTCNTLASSFSENANVTVAFSEENNAEEFQKRNYQREGVSLKPWASNPRRGAVKVRAGKTALGCTKRSRSRKSRARTQGFRVRMQTPGGRRVLKRRRAKGRKVLVPQSNPSSGKRA